MSATTTSRKRQLDEAQDTNQSTSAKESKISKTEDRKVQSSVVADSEDIQQKKCQKGEEKPKGKNILKRLPCEMICHIFRYLPEKDLFNQMLSDRFFEKSAGYVLQRRKIRLYTLNVKYATETVLKVTTRSGKLFPEYELNVENAAALCEGYEEKKGNNLTRAVYLLLSYYTCSVADVTSDNYTNEIPLTMEAFFGPAPSEPGERIKIGCQEIGITSSKDLGILFRWFCPKSLHVWDSPPWLIQASQEEVKQLVVGIDELVFFTDGRNAGVDKMMEACDAKDIWFDSDCYWSDESILSVIKANASCDNNGATRTIEMEDPSRSNTQWKVLFAPLMNSYEENPEDSDVEYTIKMPNCDFHAFATYVKLVLSPLELC